MKKTLLRPASIPRPILGSRFITFALGMLCVIGQVELCHAQGTPDVNATLSGVQVGSTYDYTLTVNNAADSVAIGTFWYAWVPGAFYMGANPSLIVPAAGWTDSIQTGPPNGFSILFNTTTALQPGTSAVFDFSSTESPATLAAEDANDSYVYTGSTAFSGTGAEVVVTSVPEPSSVALMLTGLTGTWFARRKR